MKRTLSAVAIILLAGIPAPAHRLDEYLQGTLISVERNRIGAQITLTPGVAVFPNLMAEIDVNADGVISEAEQRAYAGQILRDLSISIDGRPLAPQLMSMEFPAIEEMKEGRGEIRVEFNANLPRGGPDRRFVFENRHQSRIAAYQVNCLVPRDPAIRVVSQNRNYSQSFYELDFVDEGARSGFLSLVSSGVGKPQGTIALLVIAGLVLLWRRSARLIAARGEPRIHLPR